jgi:hypothetical protein
MINTLQLPENHTYKDGRHCTSCGVFKLANDFSLEKDSRSVGGISMRSQCRPCREHIKWKSFIIRTYGITAEDYYNMLANQDNKCALCGSEEVNNSRITSGKLFIDHCHDTGKVRGLLCSKCNHAIGLLNDDIDLLRKAITYLNKH